MMKRRSVVLVVGLMCLVLAMGASAAQVEEQTFALKADGSVSVDNSAGETVIHAWDKEEVRMITTRKGSGADKIEIIIEAREDYLKIETEYPVFSWFQRPRVNYELWVPEGATLRITASSGNINVEGQRSDVRANASSGNIELADIWGAIDAGTSSGSIRAEDSKGDIIARSSSGGIRILGVEATEGELNDIRVHATSGRIVLKNIEANIDAETSSGNISIDNSQGNISASCSSGGINIVEAQGAVESLRTSSGKIYVELEEVDEDASEMSFQSSSGDISLFLPADIDAEVDIRTTSGRISTDFRIAVEGTLEKNELQGTIGAGGTLIRLRATSGDVSLRSL